MEPALQKILLRKVLDISLEVGGFIVEHLGKFKNLFYKGRINLVTDIDKGSQELIIKKLKKVLPEADFFAEEKNNIVKKTNKSRWIIDPLDGTTNFVHGFPFFCVSIALQENSEIILASVYDPIRKERFSALKGMSSFLNNQHIHVSKTKLLKQSLIATGFSYKFKELKDNNIGNFIKLLVASQAIRRAGSAALDLCYVACGRFDGFWELDLRPWDTAAGILIVKEAGGRVTNFKNIEYSFEDKEILATNKLIHPQMLKQLNANKKEFLRFV